MKLSHPLRWAYETQKVELLAYDDTDSVPQFAMSNAWRAHLTYASHVAEITEGLIDNDVTPLQAIGVAVVAACMASVESAGYAMQLDKAPSDSGSYQDGLNVLNKTWAHSNDLSKWRKSSGPRAAQTQLEYVYTKTNTTDWYGLDHDTMAPVSTPHLDFDSTSAEFIDDHLVVDLNGRTMSEEFVRNGVWSRKEVAVTARQVVRSELVKTVLQNGKDEAINTAYDSDWVVTNPGGERYVLSDDTFKIRHAAVDADHGKYVTKGDGIYIKNPYGVPVCIKSPWNPSEYMFGDADCGFMAAFDPDAPIYRQSVRTADRYVIGRQEKLETYRPAIFLTADDMVDDPKIQKILPGIVVQANRNAYDPSADALLDAAFRTKSLTRKILRAIL